jgi:hypothetical protein
VEQSTRAVAATEVVRGVREREAGYRRPIPKWEKDLRRHPLHPPRPIPHCRRRGRRCRPRCTTQRFARRKPFRGLIWDRHFGRRVVMTGSATNAMVSRQIFGNRETQ